MLAGDKICWLRISVQSTQLRSDLLVLENLAADLYWRSLSEAFNAEGELGSLVVREMMSDSTSLGWTRRVRQLNDAREVR